MVAIARAAKTATIERLNIYPSHPISQVIFGKPGSASRTMRKSIDHLKYGCVELLDDSERYVGFVWLVKLHGEYFSDMSN